jgi:hypothetical protein
MISSADVANEKPDAAHNAAHIVTAIKPAVFPHLYVIFFASFLSVRQTSRAMIVPPVIA